ncbi:MAG: serine/threonine protein kinase, partial [Myxococcaceae bacterium]|nr:serine/threonine protein kinase [Myxococcaceae bacterium]
MTATLSKTPRQLGPYVVGAKIAGGGMATVFVGRAHQPDGSEKVVALKVIKDELLQKDTFVHMFLDEAKILSQLSHPNVIDTIECGIEGEHRYIAMELLLGRSVADAWDAVTATGSRFEPKLAAWICARIADGLHYAHELKDPSGNPLHVIHRDVNPTNIFLTYDGRVKLIDFGLAKAVGRRSKSAQGIVKGKIPYLAPEMIGEAEIDRRADIYTLGITLWEITTGERLFKRKTDIDTLQAIQKAQVPDPTEKIAGYPEELASIVKRALEPDRNKRWSTAAQIAAALDAFIGDVGDDEMRSQLETFLERTFPGERDKQDAWLEEAMHGERAGLNTTVRPPAPVPTRAKGEESSARHSSPPHSSPPPTPPILMPAPVILPPPAATPRKSKPPKGKKKRHSGRPGELKTEPPKSGLSKEKDAKEKER